MESNWGVKAFVGEREESSLCWPVQIVMETGGAADREIRSQEELEVLLEEFRVPEKSVSYRGASRQQLEA